MMPGWSFKRGLIGSITFNVISKGLVFLVNIIIVNNFNSVGKTDIYFFCFSYGVLIVTFFSSLCTTVVMPGMMHLAQIDQAHAESFLNKLYCHFILVLSLVLAPVFLFPKESFSLISKFSIYDIEQNITLIRLAIVAAFVQCICAFLTELLNAKNFFIVPPLVAMFNSILIISSVYLFRNYGGISIVFMSNIAAYSASILIQLWILAKRIHWRFQLSDLNTVIDSVHYKNLIMTAVGSLSMILAAYVPVYLFSGETSGWLTSLNISQRISEIPNSLLITQFASVMGIRFIEGAVRNDMTYLNKNFLQSSEALLFVSIPISFLLGYFSSDVVKILFSENAIEANNVGRLAGSLLQILAVAVPFVGLNVLMGRLLLGLRLVKTSFIYQLAINSLLILASFGLFTQLGPKGYALGYTSVYILNFLFSYFLISSIAPFINYRSLFFFFLTVLPINGIALVCTFAIDTYFIFHLPSMVRVITGSSIFVAIVVLGGYLFPVSPFLTEEMRNILQKISLWIRNFLKT